MKIWTDEETAAHRTPWHTAVVMKIIDGDTLELMLDLGFDAFVEVRLRLISERAVLEPQLSNEKVGIDAFEKKGETKEKGLLAMARAEALAPVGSVVRVFSRKGGTRDSFRRWLGVVLTDKMIQGGWVSLGDQLLEEGHAIPWVKK